ncbi:hypothetical protein EVAR_10985_1 [Eumeta japonica]|uniref:Uncharacterized protein n=1 Tax=Eumeta variegata TaxID=151549 RepID=A0A4C1U7J7_EUMVA|nr:hypothetical protein EVAR_10985_1 [Eumeta japonica]
MILIGAGPKSRSDNGGRRREAQDVEADSRKRGSVGDERSSAKPKIKTRVLNNDIESSVRRMASDSRRSPADRGSRSRRSSSYQKDIAHRIAAGTACTPSNVDVSGTPSTAIGTRHADARNRLTADRILMLYSRRGTNSTKWDLFSLNFTHSPLFTHR